MGMLVWLSPECRIQFEISFMCRSDGISYKLAHHLELSFFLETTSLFTIFSPSELENGPLRVGPAGAHVHVRGVLHGGDGAGGQQNLLPTLLQVDDVDSVILLLEYVLLHGGFGVTGSNVGGGSQHLCDVIFLNG